ncbi:TPA: hypothetical protein ACH3X1_006151 [Trebouxia sp. C0004]
MVVIQNDIAVITNFKAHNSSLGGGAALCDVLGYTRNPKQGADRPHYEDHRHTAAMKGTAPKLHSLLLQE